MRITRLLSVALLLGGCATSPPADPVNDREAPWSGGYVSADTVSPLYIREWSRAENRDVCTPVAPVGAMQRHPEAVPRAATFSGGWAVAYDLPGQRSAFGVAGTGVIPDGQTYDEWPYRIDWSDGSSAGYGLEGGTGPNYLAYLEIAGEKCLYNVWSALGRSDLETLLSELRFVDVSKVSVRSRSSTVRSNTLRFSSLQPEVDARPLSDRTEKIQAGPDTARDSQPPFFDD